MWTLHGWTAASIGCVRWSYQLSPSRCMSSEANRRPTDVKALPASIYFCTATNKGHQRVYVVAWLRVETERGEERGEGVHLYDGDEGGEVVAHALHVLVHGLQLAAEGGRVLLHNHNHTQREAAWVRRKGGMMLMEVG